MLVHYMQELPLPIMVCSLTETNPKVMVMVMADTLIKAENESMFKSFLRGRHRWGMKTAKPL